MLTEKIYAEGHPNVLCLHRSTSEFTCEKQLTPRGDCIFAVGADKGMGDLSDEFKEALRSEDAVLTLVVECAGLEETVRARGHPNLNLTHPTDYVLRKSDYVCARTIGVRADKAAADFSRELVDQLKKAGTVNICLEVETV